MEEVYRSICNTTQRTKTQLNSHCSDHYWYYWSLFWQHASIRFLSWLWFQEHSEWISTLLWMFRHVWRLASSQSGADAFSLIPINVHFGLIGWERGLLQGIVYVKWWKLHQTSFKVWCMDSHLSLSRGQDDDQVLSVALCQICENDRKVRYRISHTSNISQELSSQWVSDTSGKVVWLQWYSRKMIVHCLQIFRISSTFNQQESAAGVSSRRLAVSYWRPAVDDAESDTPSKEANFGIVLSSGKLT